MPAVMVARDTLLADTVLGRFRVQGLGFRVDRHRGKRTGRL